VNDGIAFLAFADALLKQGAVDLVILAVQDFTGEPVAQIHLPARIQLGFHGSWLPGD
jgi:carotenoid cleavage dioxygenase-like enzyme